MREKQSRCVPGLWDLPQETVSRAGRVTLSGRGWILIEYHMGLLGYESTYVDIRTGVGTLRILGSELCIAAMDGQTILVSGKIAGVEYA